MMRALANINGKILKPEHAQVSVFDRGFLFGDGVYETGCSYQRTFLFLEDHIHRLRKSAGRLGIPVPWSDDFLKQQLQETAQAFGQDDIYFRMIITRGEVTHVGLDIHTDQPTLVILVQELSRELDQLRTRGYHLATSQVRRNPSQAQDPNIKSSNYLNSILALKDVRERGAMDAILLNGEGHVTEGTTFSVFSISPKGILRTPALSVGILDGITRRYILAVAQGICPSEEGAYSLEEFQNAQEVFIASSVRGICPVFQWDEHRYQTPGALTLRLQEAYRKKLDEEVLKSPSRF